MREFCERVVLHRKKINFVWLGSAAGAVIDCNSQYPLVMKRSAVCLDCSKSVEMYALHARHDDMNFYD